MWCPLSIISTLIFDYIRDYYCHKKCDCQKSPTLLTNSNYGLEKNWIILALSYNYAYFYGSMASKSILPMYQFGKIVIMQRFMCLCVMNNIHKRTSPLVHAGYYLLYFIGGGVNNKSQSALKGTL